MMHNSCSSSQGNMVGPCSCGLFHNHHHHSQSNSSSFSMLFSMPNNHKPFDQYHHNDYEPDHHMYSFGSPDYYPSSNSVDCTLSLGTPSTRLSSEEDVVEKRSSSSSRHERRSDSCVSNFCWDLLQPIKHSSSSSQTTKNGTTNSRSSAGSSNNTNNNDPLLARRCANCDTTSTPLWRNGPRGPKSLCNACGIRFKKEERRASAAAATNGVMEPSHMFNSSNQYHHHHPNNPWSNFPQTAQKMPCLSPANEFRFMDDHDTHHQYESDTGGISFLSWRLNVTDRPSLVHDFTR